MLPNRDPNLAPDEIHQLNLELVATRNKWRRQYALLSKAIHDLKKQNARRPRASISHALDVLRGQANHEMYVRSGIGADLKYTAHKWI